MRYVRILFALILFGDACANPIHPVTAPGSPSVSTSASAPIFNPKPSFDPRTRSLEPCALVGSEIDQWKIANPTNPIPTIAAETAYRCMQSIPLVKPDALQLITGLAPYFDFQSTIGFLKNPPHGYLFPGVDLPNALAGIEEKVRNDSYSNEYDFQADLLELVTSVRDGHFNYYPNGFLDIFGFETELSAISISTDGLELPQIFVSSQSDSTLSSPVVSINGQDPTAYLQSWSAKISTEHDPDAMYNRLFSGVARNLDTTGNTFSNSAVYPGPFTTLTFENGTTIKKRNIAKVLRDFSGVNSGQSFYTHFLVASDSATADDAPTSTTALLPPPIGYPSPLVRHHLNSVAGYALNSPNNQDVAVLAIPNFSTDGQDIQLFQYVVETFFTEAKTLGKKKLIIDLQSNPGGTVYQGYDVFGQLFPHIALYNAANLRATPDLDLLGQGISDLVGKSFVPETDPANYDLSSQTNQAATAPWSFRHDIKPDGRTPYGSWPEIFGPMMAPHDNLTNLFRENLTDPLTIANGLVVTGTLNRSGFTQPFAAEDIIMLHDGLCGSTCAILSELLKTQAGVRSIAVGGRPQYGPMQAVGGAKGSRVYPFETIPEFFKLAYSSGSTEYQAKINNAQTLNKFPSYPLGRAIGFPTFNTQNNIRLGDSALDPTPLQFVYEAADCRLFYTREMITNISVLWERVADVAFGTGTGGRFDSEFCVRDSIGHPSAEPNVTDYASYEVPVGARCQFCVGDYGGIVLPGAAPNVTGYGRPSVVLNGTGLGSYKAPLRARCRFC